MVLLIDFLKTEYEEAKEYQLCMNGLDYLVIMQAERDKETEHNNCNLKKGSQITFCDNELIVIYLSQRRKKIFNNKHIGIITENNGIITKNKEKCINFNVNVTMKLAGVAKRDGIQVYKKN